MKILFATGGTGGHVNPALAVANRIKTQMDADILFVGTPNHIEARLVPNAGFDFKTIEISGFNRTFSSKAIKHNLGTIKRMFKSSRDSRKIIEEFGPDVVVGFGGYVSGPVLRTAHKVGIPIAIHEQNAFPGVTNKALAKVADLVMLTSKDAINRIKCKNEPVLTGLPVRDELINANRVDARKKLNIPDGIPLVLSMGGSLGAKKINEAICGLIANKKDDRDCIFIHATGKNGLWVLDRLRELGVDLDNRDDIRIREYIDDMEVCMPAADIVICRCGASSLYEIRALGKASILIPSPNVAENHQYFNGLELQNNGAAILFEEKDLTADLLTEKVNELIQNPQMIEKLEKNAKAMTIPNATDLIVEHILKLVK